MLSKINTAKVGPGKDEGGRELRMHRYCTQVKQKTCHLKQAAHTALPAQLRKMSPFFHSLAIVIFSSYLRWCIV